MEIRSIDGRVFVMKRIQVSRDSLVNPIDFSEKWGKSMAFDYDKNKNAHSNDSFWTSYSDLFLGLSAIFLLLYVTSSLRTGTDAIKGQVENQKLTMKVEELENQLKMYESVKTNYMQKEAARDEVQEYQELMDKLTLLEEEAKDDKERLAREALENERKAKALNKYQQMVRNILNANKVAKSRIISRGEVIGEQIEEIGQQKNEIAKLEADVEQKKKHLEENERKIMAAEESLKKNMQDLQAAYKANKMTKKAYEQRMKSLKDQNQKQLDTLQAANQKYEGQIQASNQKISQLGRQLASTQSELDATQSELGATKSDLDSAKTALGTAKSELDTTLSALDKTRSNLTAAKGALQAAEATAASLKGALDKATTEAQGLRGQIGDIQAAFAAERAKERAAFDNEMKRLKLGAAERAAREAAFRAAADAKEKNLQRQLSGLEGQLRDTEGALAKAKEEIDTRRAVAREIRKGFAQAGVKADIDMQTGEVVLDFGDAYFESDSANIKPEMRKVLEKAMPIYSKSLFGNPNLRNKISAVEIIGFASPTYKGRYIDPASKNPGDREAIKYNMDLSYRRANSIFQHLLDEKSPDFKHQQDLLSLMKVSGRSFLEVMNVQQRNIATAAEFCRVNDCKKAQRVIVRFSMDGKK